MATEEFDKRWTVKDFEIGRKLGEGRFAKVYMGRHVKSKRLVALKVLSREVLSSQKEVRNQIKREMEIQNHCRHRNITRLYGWYHDDERIYLVLEYANGGTIYQQVKLGRLTESVAAMHTLALAKALAYLHERNISHRDVKPENLLLYNGQLKLADFTCALYSASQTRRQTMCGTLDYIAPELISQTECDPATLDMWSCGVVVFEMVVGKPPFDGDVKDTCSQIQTGDYRMPAHVSQLAADCIRGLLQRDTGARLRAAELVVHPWILQHMNQSQE